MPPTRRIVPLSESRFSLMVGTVSQILEDAMTELEGDSPAGVMRMRRPMRWKTGSPSSSSRSRI